MRITTLAAGLALGVAACGGGEKKAETPPSTTTPAAEQPATPGPAAPAAGGTTHEVKMVLEGTTYKYVPNKLTIKAGDVIKFTSASGGPHNVQFYPDSIPANVPGPIKALAVAPPEKGGNIVSESMKMDGESLELSFAGAPAGTYKFFCAPHHALGMTGEVTVQ
jgi:plastocyanin